MTSNTKPNRHVLRNNEVEIVVNNKGAELTSLKTSDREYIWQANPEFWSRHAPILFPIVGRLIDHEFIYDKKVYSMNQHGFARDSDFNLVDKTENSIVFELVDNKKTKENFPFEFSLQVKYTLLQKSLITEYTVKNPSLNEDLYFSIGAHPAFNCPFEAEHHRNEYQLVFDKELAPEAENIIEGLLVETATNVFGESGKLTIHDAIFDKDALIFKPNPFSKVTFVHEPTQKAYFSVSFKNYPYLGIWSSHQEAPFVCIEPWHGITDVKNHNKLLNEKEGIINLPPQNSFSCSYTMEVL